MKQPTKPSLSTYIIGGIFICVTVIMILISGALSNDDTEIKSAPVTDYLFTPESVVKLTEENEQLREKANDIGAELGKANEKIYIYDKLSEATYYLSVDEKEKATDVLSSLDITTMDENARIIYEFLTKGE